MRATAASKKEHVPSTLPDAARVFLQHPSIAITVSGITVLTAARLTAPVQPVDAAIALLVGVFWLFQEHIIHDKLLHSTFSWAGRDIHNEHHTKPYHHVSIDEPPLVLAFMAASAALFFTLFQGHPSFLTATVAYYCSGLWYMWSHYLVHTRYVPRSKLLRTIRTNHMLHHCRNEAFWFSFGAPIIDRLFNTAPPPSSVPLSDLAKLAVAPAARPRSSQPASPCPSTSTDGAAAMSELSSVVRQEELVSAATKHI